MCGRNHILDSACLCQMKVYGITGFVNLVVCLSKLLHLCCIMIFIVQESDIYGTQSLSK